MSSLGVKSVHTVALTQTPVCCGVSEVGPAPSEVWVSPTPISLWLLYQVRPVCLFLFLSVFEVLNALGLKSDTCGTALTRRGTSHSGIGFQKETGS